MSVQRGSSESVWHSTSSYMRNRGRRSPTKVPLLWNPTWGPKVPKLYTPLGVTALGRVKVGSSTSGKGKESKVQHSPG